MVPRLPRSRALSAECPGEAEVGQSDPGRHNWGPYQGWPGTARGTCGEGRACVRVCVCACACVCVCDDGGLWIWTTSTCLQHECGCQFVQNHTLET